MLLEFLHFLIGTATSILGALLLLRAWTYYQAFSPRQPFAHVSRRGTDWLVTPISKVIPKRLSQDWPSLAAALLTAVVTVVAQMFLTGLPATPVAIIAASFATVVRWGLDLVSWGVLISCVLSWLQPQSPMAYALGALVEPILRPIRRLLPTIGRFDFSPVVVIIVANALLILVLPVSRGYLMI